MGVVLDHQLPVEDLADVHVDSGVDGEEQLAIGGGQFHIRWCPHGGHQTVIGQHDDIGQAGWIPDVLRAEVQQRLLDYAVGQVRPESVDDVPGEAHHIGVVVDIGEIGGDPDRIRAPGRRYRR